MGRLRRNTELGLILMAGIITAGAYGLASLGETASVPADIGPFLGVVLGLMLTAHLATRRFAPEADALLLPLALLLNGLGYVFITRLAGEDPDLGDLPGLQATWTALGVSAYVATLVAIRRIKVLQRYRYLFALGGMILLLMPLLPVVGREIRGSRIWASIGPVNVQPGEFAKLALAIFFAAYLIEKRELLQMATFRVGRLYLPEPKHFGPLLAAWGASLVVMILEKDLGSSLLFFALFIVMLWIATERASYLAVGVGLFAAGAFVTWSQFSHVQDRIDVWLNPWQDASGIGYQPIQASFALAEGGLTGTGIGLGEPQRIPIAESDYIFAAIGEELGLIGSTAILAAFMLFVGSGLRVAVRSTPRFDKLLAAGLSVLIGFQAFIIIGGVIRLVPLTGITLPFVSYGGSSLLSNYILLALLVRISDETSQREADAPSVAMVEAPA